MTTDIDGQLPRAMDYDAGEPNPRDFYPAFAGAVRDELDAPGVDSFNPEPAATPAAVRMD